MFQLPKLPYAFDALEPYLDTQTIKIHYSKHHQVYVDKANAALEKFPDLQTRSVEDLLKDLNQVPEAVRTAVRNHGGGHANHSFFWQVMGPKGGGEPKGEVATALTQAFGSFAAFQKQFTETATGVFGSGWAWLVKDQAGKLAILATSNQDSPLSSGQVPVLALDVWEHAYYLKYQNRRPEYIKVWWNVINWDQVSKNFQK